MKKKNIAWLLSAAMILTTAAAPVETVAVYAADEFQAETDEAEGTEIAEDTETGEEASEVSENEDVADTESNVEETATTGETVSEDSQDNDTSNLELFEDSTEELEVNTEADNSDTEELQADVEDGFSDGEAAVASAGESSEVVDSGSCGSDATYKLYGDGRLVIEGSGLIDSDSFNGKTNIKYIEIKDGITSIGDYAFGSCEDLRKVTLPESLENIGNGAFRECSRLDSIVLPDKITEIGDDVFDNSGLTEVKLPQKLTRIGNGAFRNCKISSISIPEILKTIGNEAFYGNNLKSAELPESIIEIGEKAFGWNYYLQSINIPKNVTEIKEGTFWGCSWLQNITLPDGLTKIGKNAFTGTILGEVTLPDSVTTIEESAFENCGLNRIKFSKNLTEIPYGTFSNCTSLTEIILPDNITHVDTNAFFNCTYLRSVYIANASTVIEKKAFGYNSDGTKQDILIMGHKGSTAETYAAENGFSFHNIKDPLTFHAESKPTCTSDGNYQYWHCEVCGRDFCNAEGSEVVWGNLIISKLGHNLTYYAGKSATCTQAGNQSYYHCETCGKNFSDWNGETEISEKDIVIPAPGHQMEYHGKNEPNCINVGMKAYYYCTRCGQYFLNQEGTQTVAESDLILPAEPQNHTMRYMEGYEATCTNEGRKSYYICEHCQQRFFDEKGTEKVTEDSELIIPVTNEHILELEQGYPAECLNPGMKDTYRCTSCGKHFLDKDGKEEVQQDSDVLIPELGHKFTDGQWVNHGSGKHTVSKGNPTPIFFTADYQQRLKCERCGFQDWGETRTYNMSVNTDQVILKNGQSTTAVRVSDFANGDYLKSVTSKDTSLVTVSNVNKNGTFKLTAKNKNGSAWVTITLNSGVKTNILVTVRVTTQAITNLKSTVSVVRGKTVTLKPVLNPVTSQDKIKYSSSNRNIAAVNSKGVITGRKVGTAKITVTSGSKKFIVTVKVTKIKTTKLTGVPKTKTVNRGKTFTIKAVATPRNTDEKVTYKSSNSRIATVNSKGVVKGVKKGTAVITVQSGSKKLTCRVTVK